MLKELLDAARREVENHSIYVWGGSGQLCKDVTEDWIRKQEAKNEGGKHTNDALNAWRAVMESEYRDVARVFDCSGYVSFCLKKIGVLNSRTNCDGLYARCKEIFSPTDGMLLFRTNPKDENDETHVGLFFSGKQYHAKGRTSGVVEEPFKASYWQKYGWFKAIKEENEKKEEKKPDDDPKQYVKVIGGSVNVRDAASTAGKHLFTSHKGDRFELIDIAETGWYHINTWKGEAYITNNEKYTQLV